MNANFFTNFFQTLNAISFELAVFAVTCAAVAVAAMVGFKRRKDKKRTKHIVDKVRSMNVPVVVFKNEKLIWHNKKARDLCPNLVNGAEVMEITWRFSGTLDQQASLYKGQYTVYTMDAFEVVRPEKAEESVSKKSHNPHYKIFSDQMELFEKVLSDNSYLLVASGITVFANKKNCELDQYPKFEQLAEAFMRVGYYLLKDKSGSHMDFLFDSKNDHNYIQMNLKNFNTSKMGFSEDFFLKGFGTESFSYQLGRLELLFETLGGSLQIVEIGTDLVLIGKVQSLEAFEANTKHLEA